MAATKKQLQDALTEAGIEFDAKAKVAELEQLAADNAVTVAGETVEPAAAAPTSKSKTVKMVGPNGGNAREVPADRVAHFEALGHTRA